MTNPFAPPPPGDPILDKINGASELEYLANLYVEHHAAWTPEHTLAAMTQVASILATERMIAEERYYRDRDLDDYCT